MGHRFGYSEDTVRLAAALRPALASRGVPTSIYVDNGSAFVDSWLLRACASLGIKLVHSTPGRPQGRGKIERFFRTVREQFLVELSTPDSPRIADLGELNRLFTAWVETEYHQRPHTSTEAAPLARWRQKLPEPAADAEPGRAAGGVPVVGAPDRDQNRHRLPAQQHLPGRPGALRPQSRAGLRPVRPHRRRGPPPRPLLRPRGRVPHRPPLPPESPTRTRRHRPAADRHRLPAPDRRRPRRGLGERVNYAALTGADPRPTQDPTGEHA